jgi:hypothetical protein
MDKRLIITVGIVIAFLIFSYPILAAATAPPVVIERDGQGRPTVIVEQGKGREAGLIKVTHIHYDKPGGSKPQPPTKTESCYKLAHWKWTNLPITYTINPNNNPLPEQTIKAAISAAGTEWDRATSKTLFFEPDTGDSQYGVYDWNNSISFGNYADGNVIAVTLTWYNTRTKEAVESDILFDTDFTWGDATVNIGVMDLQNIATHEIGHTLGLSDTYSTSCQNVTMYGYSIEGEIAKRTLAIPDITGLQKIYGS